MPRAHFLLSWNLLARKGSLGFHRQERQNQCEKLSVAISKGYPKAVCKQQQNTVNRGNAFTIQQNWALVNSEKWTVAVQEELFPGLWRLGIIILPWYGLFGNLGKKTGFSNLAQNCAGTCLGRILMFFLSILWLLLWL